MNTATNFLMTGNRAFGSRKQSLMRLPVRMGGIVLLVASLLVGSTAFAAEKVGWVTGYWAGWAGVSPREIPWKTYTHVCIFSATPDARGGCKLAMGWKESSVKAAVAEGHKHNVKMLLCVGGAGTGRNFVGSTADAAVRATFIKNIVRLMREYGFDGVDMDWEELQGKNAEYVALHKELRAELDKITPRPLLTAAIANWMFNRTTAQIHPHMDQLNNMSYWTRIIKNGAVDEADIAKDMQGLVDKGVPKAKLGVGIGLDYEEGKPEVDCDPRACEAKCRFAVAKGFGGVMIWAIQKDAKKNDGKHPCHDAVAPFTPAVGNGEASGEKKE
jgi:chitinase